MKLGDRMVRLDDGMRGVVAQNGPELRIVYTDRGEERLATRAERWIPDETEPRPLRQGEMQIVALYADRALRAIEQHEPLRYWEPPRLTDAPYDAGLYQSIIAHLSLRQPRSL